MSESGELTISDRTAPTTANALFRWCTGNARERAGLGFTASFSRKENDVVRSEGDALALRFLERAQVDRGDRAPLSCKQIRGAIERQRRAGSQDDQLTVRRRSEERRVGK